MWECNQAIGFFCIYLLIIFQNYYFPPLLGGYQTLVQSQFGFHAIIMQRIAWVSFEVILEMIFEFQGM
jgi:hypothetical protein